MMGYEDLSWMISGYANVFFTLFCWNASLFQCKQVDWMCTLTIDTDFLWGIKKAQLD
jgi:hypothetical protein